MSETLTTDAAGPPGCRWCGMIHGPHCPSVKAMEFHQDGSVKRVEFYDESIAYMTPSQQDLARANEIEERILFRLREGLASVGLSHVNVAPNRLAEFIAIHIAEVREEGRQQGAVEAHRLWQSGALPAEASNG